MGKFIKAFFQGRLFHVNGYWVIQDLHHMIRVDGKLVYNTWGWLTFTVYKDGRIIATHTKDGRNTIKAIWTVVRIDIRETIQKFEAWKKIHPGRV